MREQGHELVEVRDHMVGGRQVVRPRVAAAIHPYRLHARVAGTGNIGLGFIPYKQDFRRFQCQRLCERHVGAHIGFGTSELGGMQRDLEVLRDTNRPEIGIAIGERGEPVLRPERRQ